MEIDMWIIVLLVAWTVAGFLAWEGLMWYGSLYSDSSRIREVAEPAPTPAGAGDSDVLETAA